MDMSFFVQMKEGNQTTMGKLQLAKNYCKKLKLPSINFPTCKIISAPMSKVGGMYTPHDNTITVFINCENFDPGESFYHEFGHWLDFNANKLSDLESFPSVAVEVSDYANASKEEAFAETFMLWMSNPESLKEKSQTRYDYMTQLFSTFQFTCY